MTHWPSSAAFCPSEFQELSLLSITWLLFKRISKSKLSDIRAPQGLALDRTHAFEHSTLKTGPLAAPNRRSMTRTTAWPATATYLEGDMGRRRFRIPPKFMPPKGFAG